MIQYDPNRWYRLLFTWRGTVLPRVISRMTITASVAFLLALWNATLEGTKYADLELHLPFLDPIGHTLLGVSLSLVVVFRNNTSYDRFWEGRKLWGSIINTSRNLVRSASAHSGPSQELASLVTAYVLALKQHLRNSRDLEEVRDHVPENVFRKADVAGNPPAVIAFYMSDWVRSKADEGRVNDVAAWGMERLICDLTDYQGGCERILKTPIPFSLAVHLHQLIALYLLSLPFVLVPKMGFLAVLVIAAVTFALLGIEEAGIELEEPFGEEPNDLPVEAFCVTVARDVASLARFGKRDVPAESPQNH